MWWWMEGPKTPGGQGQNNLSWKMLLPWNSRAGQPSIRHFIIHPKYRNIGKFSVEHPCPIPSSFIYLNLHAQSKKDSFIPGSRS